MKILVLGGAGYIGSHTVYRLIESGNEVVVFDNLETGHIEAVHPKAKFYKGDLRNRSEIDSVFDKEKGIDAVIHFRCGRGRSRGARSARSQTRSRTGR